MRIAVLVKQIPEVRGDGARTRRTAAPRRHRARDEPLLPARGEQGGRARRRARRLAGHVFTLGPPAADDTLREAIAWGLDRGVDIERRARDRRRVRGLRHARDGEGARRGARRAKARSISCSPAATRSTPTPARSGPRSPSSSTSRSSPACATSRSSGNARRRPLRARRRLDAGRGRAARGAVVRGAAVRAGEGRPAGPGRGAGRTHPPCRAPPTSAPGRGAPTRRPRGSGR